MIIHTLQEHSDILLNPFHIQKMGQKMGFFGAFSRNQQPDTQTEKSNVDFIIELEPNTSDFFKNNHHLRTYLSQLFSRKSDLAYYKYLKPYAREEILSEVDPIV